MKLFTIPLFLIAIIGCSSSSIDLCLKFQEAKTFTYLVKIDQEIKQTIENQPLTIKQELTLKYYFKIESVRDDAALLQFSFNFIDLSIGSNINDIKLPDDFSNILNKIFIPDGKKPVIRINLSNKGKVEYIEGYSQYMQKILSEAKKESLPPHVIEIISSLSDSKSMGQNISTLFAYIPEKSVESSSTWEKTRKIENLFPLTLKTRWKIKSITDELIKLQSTDTIEADEGNKLFKDFSGIQSSDYLISGADHWPIEVDVEQIIKTDILPGAVGAKGASVIGLEMHNNTVIKRIELQ